MKKKAVAKKQMSIPVQQPKRNFYNPMGYWGNTQSFSFSQMPSFVKLPLVGFRKPEALQNPDRNLTYPQAKQKFGLAPFGNWDRDSHLNVFDCRPFDITRHKVTPALKDKPVSVAGRKDLTFGKVFEELESTIEPIYKQGGSTEEEYSRRLETALTKREELRHHEKWPLLDKVFEDIVGEYKIKVPLDIRETKLVLENIKDYLDTAYPDVEFEFNLGDPNHVTVLEIPERQPMFTAYTTHPETGKRIPAPDPTTGRVEVVKKDGKTVYAPPERDRFGEIIRNRKEGVKLSTYIDLKKAPATIVDDFTKMKGVQEITFVITDNPADIIRKSSVYGSDRQLLWSSCETLKPIHPIPEHAHYEKGPFSDVSHRNAIAWFYYEGRNPKTDPPSGRVMIRWGVADDGTVDVGVEEVAYPKAKTESQAISTAIRKKLVEKGYTLKNVKTLFDSDAYLDNMHVREIRHKTAKVYGVHPDTLPNQREGQRKEWYYGLKNPSFGEEESLEQTRTKYLEEHQGRFPFSIALSFVKRPETEKYVLPLVEKDVPEPIIKKMITHPDEQVRIGLTSRSLKDLADVPMSQKFWVNMTPAMMQKLGAENQPAKVRAHVLLSKNPLPEGLKEEILSAPNVANILIREVTIDESLAKGLLKTHKSPDIRSAFIEHKLREEWMPWAVPMLLEGNNAQVIKQLIDYKASQLPKSVLLKLCGSDTLKIKQAILGNLSEVRLDGKCIQALLTKGAPLSDDNMSYLFRNVGEDILSALDLKTTKMVVAREDPDLIQRVLALKLHNTPFGHQTNPTSIAERNAIWKEVLKQDEITSTVVSYICMDTNLDINLLKKVIPRFLPDDNFLPLLIQYTTSAPSKHLLFQYIKKEKLDTSDKIMLYKGLLTDLDTNNVLYSTIKKELLRLTTGTTTKK